MAPNDLCGGVRTPYVLLRLEYDYINLGKEKEDERHCGRKAERQAHCDGFVGTSEINRQKRQPDYARRVHCET